MTRPLPPRRPHTGLLEAQGWKHTCDHYRAFDRFCDVLMMPGHEEPGILLKIQWVSEDMHASETTIWDKNTTKPEYTWIDSSLNRRKLDQFVSKEITETEREILDQFEVILHEEAEYSLGLYIAWWRIGYKTGERHEIGWRINSYGPQ